MNMKPDYSPVELSDDCSPVKDFEVEGLACWVSISDPQKQEDNKMC